MNWQDWSFVSLRCKKEKKTFCERAWQLILNNRENLIRQKWKSKASALLSFFQLNNVFCGSIDEEECNRGAFGNRWQDRSGVWNQRSGYSVSSEEEKRTKNTIRKLKKKDILQKNHGTLSLKSSGSRLLKFSTTKYIHQVCWESDKLLSGWLQKFARWF